VDEEREGGLCSPPGRRGKGRACFLSGHCALVLTLKRSIQRDLRSKAFRRQLLRFEKGHLPLRASTEKGGSERKTVEEESEETPYREVPRDGYETLERGERSRA